MTDDIIDRPPERSHVGQFRIIGGRCDVYRREDRITLFFFRDGKASAFHMEVPAASGAGSALLHAAETTPYDEAKLEENKAKAAG